MPIYQDRTDAGAMSDAEDNKDTDDVTDAGVVNGANDAGSGMNADEVADAEAERTVEETAEGSVDAGAMADAMDTDGVAGANVGVETTGAGGETTGAGAIESAVESSANKTAESKVDNDEEGAGAGVVGKASGAGLENGSGAVVGAGVVVLSKENKGAGAGARSRKVMSAKEMVNFFQKNQRSVNPKAKSVSKTGRKTSPRARPKFTESQSIELKFEPGDLEKAVGQAKGKIKFTNSRMDKYFVKLCENERESGSGGDEGNMIASESLVVEKSNGNIYSGDIQVVISDEDPVRHRDKEVLTVLPHQRQPETEDRKCLTDSQEGTSVTDGRKI